jgi:hypothetical protein
MSVGGGKGKSKSKSRVQVPEFLQPFLNQATGTAGSALGSLQQQAGGNLVAPFTPTQNIAQMLGISQVLGQDSPFMAAQNAVQGIAQGGQVPGMDFLQQLRQGGSGVPQQAMDTLGQFAQGGDLAGMDILSQLAGQSAIPQQTLDTLNQTAQGDFLFGGQGFDQAVDAAVRAALPRVGSAFGGRTGAGLADAAIGRSATDAFASQFAQERQNQLGAAGTLGQLGLAGQGQQAGIAQALASLGLGQGQQQIGAAGALGQLGLAGQGQQADIAGLLGQLGLAGQGQQLAAAFGLPDVASAGFNLLSGIGDQQQALDQSRIDAPFNAQMALLQAALGGLPISSLFGQNTTGRQSGLSFSGDL